MIQRIGFLFAIIFMSVGYAHADSFDFNEFAIVDSGDADLTTSAVRINLDAGPATVSAFDIAGIYLGMPFEDVHTLFYRTNAPYVPRQRDSIVYTMHKEWKYNLDYECRQDGIVIPSELERCINTLARNRGLLYASEMHLVRNDTGETIDVFFTSNATNNVVWKVEYNNDVNELEGPAEKFENQRQKKILAFWQGVLDKYGAPNSGTDKWLTSNNAYDPMMTAYYGALVMTDNGLHATDAALAVQQARERFQTKPYAF